MKAALSQLLPDFQKSSGNMAIIEYGPAGAIAGRIQNDDAADVVLAEDLRVHGRSFILR